MAVWEENMKSVVSSLQTVAVTIMLCKPHMTLLLLNVYLLKMQRDTIFLMS